MTSLLRRLESDMREDESLPAVLVSRLVLLERTLMLSQSIRTIKQRFPAQVKWLAKENFTEVSEDEPGKFSYLKRVK